MTLDTDSLFEPLTPANPGRIRKPHRLLTGLPPETRFWMRVHRGDDPAACWLWTGSTDSSGYGNFRVAQRATRTHRYSWELHRGPIPDGLQVLHHCDVRRCVNPDHLFLGTNDDNVADKVAKGRNVSFSGSRNGSARLTEDQVASIRQAYQPGLAKVLARQYGVSDQTVLNIVHRRKWRSVP